MDIGREQYELGKSSGRERLPEKQAEELAAEIWQDIHNLTKNIKESIQKLPESESLHKILDALKPPAEPACAAKPVSWTFAINYTTDFGDGQGVESGLKMLNAFTAKTKGKDVTIVAQAAIAKSEEDKKEDVDEFKSPEDNPASKYRLERYVIKDGEIRQISKLDSKGYARDLEDLLNYAGKKHPGKRMGLVIDSHGMGNEGLSGDTGDVTVAEFVKAVKDGLKAGGKEKLDLIDFDCCLMAQHGAVTQIKQVTDHIVASAETEGIYNAQNYLLPIERVLEKPDTDGLSVARDIVTQTHKDMEQGKKEGKEPQVDTLSHLVMKHHAEFKKSLDSFGDELCEAIKDPEKRELIEKAIDASIKYGSDGGLLALLFGERAKHRTDLKDFTERILAVIDNGELADPERKLKRSAQELMNSRSRLVDSYHGNDIYGKAGGLSVFLPSRHLRNIDNEAKLATAAGRLCKMTDGKNFETVNGDEKARQEFIQKVNREISATRPHLFFFGVRNVDKELNSLQAAIDEFAAAGNDKDRQRVFTSLHQAALDLEKTEAFQEIIKNELESRKTKAAKIFKANLVEDGSEGWSRFRLKLKDGK